MTWFKVDDLITDHPKMIALSPYAWTLWIHGMAYCSRNLTDGKITRPALRRLSGLDDAESACVELVEAGAWVEVEDGWLIANYLEHQTSRDDVEAERAAAAERQRKSRAARKEREQNNSHSNVTEMSQRDNPVSHSNVTAPDTDTDTDTPPNPPDTAGPVDNQREGEIQKLVDAVAEHQVSLEPNVRSKAGLKRHKISQIRADSEMMRRIGVLVDDFHDPPLSTCVAFIQGEPATHLNNYRKKETA